MVGHDYVPIELRASEALRQRQQDALDNPAFVAERDLTIDYVTEPAEALVCTHVTKYAPGRE
jgi:hypothetical protein